MRRFFAVLMALIICLAFAPVAYAAPNTGDQDGVIATPGNEKSVPNEILVTFRKGSDKAKHRKLLADESLETVSDLDVLYTKVIKLPPGKSLSDIKGLAKKYTEVTAVEPNYIAYASEDAAIAPNDPVYTKYMRTSLSKAHIEQMWGIANSVDTVVAVLDTGVFAGHSDLAGRILPGYDFVNNDADPADDNGHGTRVTGFIAANGNNGNAIAGINWGVRILPVKVMGSGGTGTVSNIAKGITYAADNGAAIINLSLGATADSTVMKAAVDYAVGKGCIVVAASGNKGTGTLEYPARYPNVIGVGAVSGGVRDSFSNYGDGLDIVTYGTGHSTTMAGSTGACAGTSFAAPLVSGVLSLAKGFLPDLDTEGARELIKTSAVDLGAAGWDKETGYGSLDFQRFLEAARTKAGGAAAALPVDTTPPQITLKGEAHMELPLGTAFVEPGYTAIDDQDGDITASVKVQNPLDSAVAGTYNLVYSATDKAGNSTQKVRVVVVAEALPEAGVPGADPGGAPAEDTKPVQPPAPAVREVLNFSGAIKGSGTKDHAITVSSAGTLDLELRWSGNKTDFDLAVLDSAGKVVAEGKTGGGNAEILAAKLGAAGKYTLRVKLVTGNGNCSYTLQATLPAPAALGDGTIPSAQTPFAGRAMLALAVIALVMALAALAVSLAVLVTLRRQRQQP